MNIPEEDQAEFFVVANRLFTVVASFHWLGSKIDILDENPILFKQYFGYFLDDANTALEQAEAFFAARSQ